jgi:hypothetical protein
VRQGDQIATEVESLIYESIPNIRQIYIHYHPTEDSLRGMSIEDMLAETLKHISAHETFVEEEDEAEVL